MKEESYKILSQVINNEFKEFKELVRSKEIDLEYDITKIHRIKPQEFEQEGYFMILCTQAMYDEIDEHCIEIWKVYKTEKYYHVLEFDQNIFDYIKTRCSSYNFNLYNYYDYDRTDDSEEYLWRGSTEILGIKLPDNFEL